MGFLRGLADWARNNIPLVGGYIASLIESLEGLIESWSDYLWRVAGKASAFMAYISISIWEAGYRLATILQSWWGILTELIGNFWSTIRDFFTKTWSSFRDWVSSGLSSLQGWLRNVWPSWEWIINQLQSAWSQFTRDPWGVISNAASRIVETVNTSLKPVFDSIDAKINAAKLSFFSAISDLSKAFNTMYDELMKRIRGVGDAFESFRRNASDAITNIQRTMEDSFNKAWRAIEDFQKNFAKYVQTSITVWEAAKGYARRKVATQIQEVMEKPETQAALIGGETAAWVANPAAGGAVTLTTLGVQTLTEFMTEQPIRVPLKSDNPITKVLLEEQTLTFEEEGEYTIGEILDSPPEIMYEWSVDPKTKTPTVEVLGGE